MDDNWGRRYTKSELKAREAVRLALSKLHSAEIRAWNIATTSRDYGPVRERWGRKRLWHAAGGDPGHKLSLTFWWGATRVVFSQSNYLSLVARGAGPPVQRRAS